MRSLLGKCIEVVNYTDCTITIQEKYRSVTCTFGALLNNEVVGITSTDANTCNIDGVIHYNKTGGYVILNNEGRTLFTISKGTVKHHEPTWSYRRVTKSLGDGEYQTGIHEVYSVGGIPTACTEEPVAPVATEDEDLSDVMKQYMDAFNKPILYYEDF